MNGRFVSRRPLSSSWAEKRYENTVALGVLGVLLGLKEEAIARALAEAFGKKEPAVLEANLRVLTASADWAARQSVKPLGCRMRAYRMQYLMMNGNDGIALGALSAGVRFCSFYPMTPSTSVALNLVEWGPKAGVAVEQAEDEIAAINMAIGASFAGAPAMVAHLRRRLRPDGRGGEPGGDDRDAGGDRRRPAARPGHGPADAHRTGGAEVRAARRPRRISARDLRPRGCRGVLSPDPQGLRDRRALPGAGLHPDRSVSGRFLPGRGAL